MKRTESVPVFLRDPNYRDLVAYYLDHPIALYTGAGASWSDDPAFGVGLWDNFVRRILLAGRDTQPETVEEFDRCKSEWKDEPWEMAGWVAEKIGREEFQRQAAALVQQPANFQKAYKLLSGKFLAQAATLNAIAAFCADFAGGQLTRDRRGHRTAVYRRSTNRRVQAVVTSNYDPYLEAASSTMFRIPILKPVAARGSSAGGLDEIPVFHIHGYIPFPYQFRKEASTRHIPFVEPVITTRDYESAWQVDNAYNFTMGPQIHILRHYVVLFVGFSFRDWKVNQLLETLNRERAGRDDRLYHYAIMKRDQLDAERRQFLEQELGVRPLLIEAFSQIKDLLGHLYRQALVHDHPRMAKIPLPFYAGRRPDRQARPVHLAPEAYFEELYRCRVSMVWNVKRKVETEE